MRDADSPEAQAADVLRLSEALAFAAEAHANGIELKVEYDGDTTAVVRGTPIKLRRDRREGNQHVCVSVPMPKATHLLVE